MNVRSKIIVAEPDEQTRCDFCSVLEGEGYEVISESRVSQAAARVEEERPDLVILDLVSPSLEGAAVCRALKADPGLRKIPVLITTRRSRREEVEQCLEWGADDYIVKPVDKFELMARIQTSIRLGRLLERQEQEKRDLFAILEISNTITSTLNYKDVLYTIVKKISEIIDVTRCSIVRVEPGEEKGIVVATSEDPAISNLGIELKKYPEVMEVLNSKQTVVINDVTENPIVQSVRETLVGIDVHALLVLPVLIKQNVIGTILLRTARRGRPFEDREVQFCQIITGAAANALINAALYENVEMANVNLERLATTDGLTGVCNHRHFYTRLEQEFNRSERYEAPLSTIMIDVDNFKEINDTYGHRVGDGILKELAEILKKTIRKSDIAARYGGDEFALLLPQTDSKGAACEAQRILRAVEEYEFETLGGAAMVISYGIASFPDEEIEKPEDMVRLADRRLYAMKAEKRNSSGKRRNKA
ncbi:MAG: diguanylate cyclase [bacterium]|nr:diguanylate cyclase [bacterium]